MKKISKCFINAVLLVFISIVMNSCMESIAPKKQTEAGPLLPTYQGCISGLAIDNSKIKIRYEYPLWASEIYIYRDGQEIFNYNYDMGSENIFIDSDLIEGHKYLYQCLAKYEYTDKRNDKQESVIKGTNALKISTKTINKPKFTGIKDVISLSASKVRITWETPENIGAEVYYYKVYTKLGNSVNMDSVSEKTTITNDYFSVDLDGFADDLSYTFGVRACSIDGVCSDNVNTITKTMLDGGSPTTVGITNAKIVDGTIVLTIPWEEKNGGVKKRKIYRSQIGGSDIASYSQIDTINVDDLGIAPVQTFVDESPEENTTYYYWVIDEDPNGNLSSNTNIVKIETGDMTPPSFLGIESITHVYPQDRVLQLNWTAGDPTDIYKYVVYVTSAKGNSVDPLPTPANPCSEGIRVQEEFSAGHSKGSAVHYNLINASPRTTYGVCVKAEDKAENVSKTTVFQVSTTEDITPPEFDGIQTLSYNGSLRITWNKSITSDIDGYKILLWKGTTTPNAGDITTIYKKHSELPSGTSVAINIAKNEFAYNDYNQVYAVVKACDNAYPNFTSNNESNCSNYPLSYPSDKTKFLQLGDTTKPIFPGITGIEKGNPADKNIVIKWKAIASQPMNAEGADKYLIYRTEVNGKGVPTDPCLEVTPIKTLLAKDYVENANVSYSLPGHVERKTYAICVKAQDAALNLSDTAASYAITTEDITAPTFNGVTQVIYNGGNIEVSWLPSTSSDIKEYKATIWRNSETIVGELNLKKAHGDFPTGFSFNNQVYPFEDGDKVYVQINACDNAAPDFGVQNCTNLNLTYAKYVQLLDTTPPVFSGLSDAVLIDSKDRNVRLTWNAIFSENVNKDGASEYLIYMTEADGINTPSDACNMSATPTPTLYNKVNASLYTLDQVVTYDVPSLTPRTSYKFCVKAKDSAGNISETNVSKLITTYDLTAPDFAGATGLTYDGATGKIKVYWNASLSLDIKEYKVQIWRNAADPVAAGKPITSLTKAHIDFPNGFEFTSAISPFTDGDKIYVLVNACDDAKPNFGPNDNCTPKTYSDAVNKVLPDLTPPAGFEGITGPIDTTEENKMGIHWVDKGNWTDYAGFKVYTVDVNNSYEITELKNCACIDNNCVANPITSCIVDVPHDYRNYTFHVRAYDLADNHTTYLNPASSKLAKRSLDITKPTFSSNINTTFVRTDGTLRVDWSAATDNQYGGDNNTIKYKLYRKVNDFTDATNPTLDGANAVLVQDSTELTYSVNLKSLTQGSTYYFTVCAYDSSLNVKCDGTKASRTITDNVDPIFTSVTMSNFVVGEPSTWDVTWSVSDAVTALADLKVLVYAKYTDTATDYPAATGTYYKTEKAGNETLAGQTSNDNDTNKTYITYRFVVKDLFGFTADKTLSKRVTPSPTFRFGTTANDYIVATAVHTNGDYAVIGKTLGVFNGTVNLGNGDVFVRKYNSNNVLQWIKMFGTTSYDYPTDAVFDSLGNVYISGYSSGTMPGNSNFGNLDAFIAKYNSNGTLLWIKQVGTNTSDYFYSIACNENDEIFVIGNTSGSLFGTYSTSGEDLILAKIDNDDGEIVQSLQRASLSIFSGKAKGFYVNSSSIYVGTGGFFCALGSCGPSNSFIMKFDINMNFLWSKDVGAYGYLRALKVDINNNIYFLADASSVSDTDYTVTSTNDTKVGFGKLDSTGTNVQWSLFTGSGKNRGTSIIVDDVGGYVYFIGDTSIYAYGSTMTGNNNQFIFKYSFAGVLKTYYQNFSYSHSSSYGAFLNNGIIHVAGNTNDNFFLINGYVGAYDGFLLGYDIGTLTTIPGN